jgi:Transposase IS4
MFIVGLNSLEEVPEGPRHRHKPKAWKRSTQKADEGALREASEETFDELITHDNEATEPSVTQKIPFWHKLEPFANHIRDTNKRLYTPSTHVIIDEAMLAFRGRTLHITKLKNKLIKEGYKVWLLADHGYA